MLAPWPSDLPRYAIHALYGLRESPAVWGSFRSKRLRGARIPFRDKILRLIPTVAEPELWLVRDESTNQLYGILVTYVDDLFYFGESELVCVLHKFILEEWPASDLEWVNEENAVRYLGVEILKCPGSDGFTISQKAYIRELLRSYDLSDIHPTHLPSSS